MNINQSFRIIFRNKTYSLLNIAGLAIGIAASALILLWVEYQVNDNRSIPKLKNLYEIGQNQPYGDQLRTLFTSPSQISDVLDDGFAGVRRCSRFKKMDVEFLSENESFTENGAYVDSTLFGMIDLPIVAGNLETAFEPAFPILISRKMMEKIFNTTDVIGHTLQIENQLYEITGVFEDREINGTFHFEWLIPMRILAKDPVEKKQVAEKWGGNWINCYVEIEPGANVPEINRKLTTIFVERAGWGERSEMFIYPLKDRRLYDEFVDGKPTGGGYISTVRTFFWVGIAILLIACINFINLTTARSGKRTMEIGLRKTFGVRYLGLVRQFMTESTFITTISILLAISSAYLCLPAFNRMIGYPLAIDFTNPYHLFGLITVGIICTLFSGLYPALYLSSFSPIRTLKKLNKGVAGGVALIQKSLVVFQFAVSFILISTTIVIYMQIQHVHKRPLGLNINHLVSFPVTDEIKHDFATIRQELINTGYVAGTGLSSQDMIKIVNSGSGYTWQGKEETVNPFVSNAHISPGVFAALEIPFNVGRDFSFESVNQKPEVIINQSFAKLIGDEGRIGGTISRFNANPMQIVGIVEDFVYNDISGTKAEPVIFYHYYGNAKNMFVKIQEGKPGIEAITAVQDILMAHSPGKLFEPVFMDETFDRMFSNYHLTKKLITLFAILAIILSCLGLFGLSAYSAELRTKEIGVRKILGATVWNIVSLLGSSFMQLLTIAFLIAVPLAWYVGNHWLEGYGYRISLGWHIIVATGVLVVLIAMLTVSVQSLRAAITNPIKAIKME